MPRRAKIKGLKQYTSFEAKNQRCGQRTGNNCADPVQTGATSSPCPSDDYVQDHFTNLEIHLNSGHHHIIGSRNSVDVWGIPLNPFLFHMCLNKLLEETTW